MAVERPTQVESTVPPKYVVIASGKVLSSLARASLAVWDYNYYRVVAEGAYSEIRELAEELNRVP